MKNVLLMPWILLACTACTKEIVSENVSGEFANAEPITVNVHCQYSITETSFGESTRANVSKDVTRLSFSVFNSSNECVHSETQKEGDENFGTLSSFKLTAGTYTLVAVAHKASNDESACATITSPTVVSMTEDYLHNTYAGVQSLTLSNTYDGTKKDVTMTLNLCVTRVQVNILDQLPANLGKVVVDVNTGTGKTAAPNNFSFNPQEPLFATDASFERTWERTSFESLIGREQIKFAVTAMMNEYPKNISTKITAYDQEGNQMITRTFDNVTVKKGTILSINTYLFKQSEAPTIQLADWVTENHNVTD